VWDRAGEGDLVVDAQSTGQADEPPVLARFGSAVVTQDHEPEPRVRTCDFGHRPERDLDALQALQPAGEDQQLLVRRHADKAFCLRFVDTLEGSEIDPRRHHRDALGRGAVLTDQVLALGGRARHQQVGFLRDAPLDQDPELWLRRGARCELAVLDATECVRDVNERQLEPAAQDETGGAGKPVMGVDEVVFDRVRLDELEHSRREAVDARDQFILGHLPLPGGDVDDPASGPERFALAITGGLQAGEDVGVDAALAEGCADLVDVHVHAAVGAVPERGGRRSVQRDHRHPPHRRRLEIAQPSG
jgi:hypothetical protein